MIPPIAENPLARDAGLFWLAFLLYFLFKNTIHSVFNFLRQMVERGD